MAATALALRLSDATRRRDDARADVCGLSFDGLGGPIVAVCGLTGGAGTTTLAWLIARQAARESTAPILVCEAEALAGGLAVLAGVATPTGLGELATNLAESKPRGASFAQIADGLRLVATVPRTGPPRVPGRLASVLGDAVDAHGLVVCDARTLDHVDALPILACATHILWVMPATAAAIKHAEVLLAVGALPPSGRAREALVAAAIHPEGGASVRCLRALGSHRHEQLVLVPHVAELPLAAGHEHHGRIAATLTQLATFLRR